MTVREIITALAAWVPVKWDRFTEDAGYYTVYGWIERDDGRADFLVLQIDLSVQQQADTNTQRFPDISFITSSAKYSEVIYHFLYGNVTGHIPCQKIENLP